MGRIQNGRKKEACTQSKVAGLFDMFFFFQFFNKRYADQDHYQGKGESSNDRNRLQGLLSVRGTVLLTLSKGAIFKMCKYRQKTGRHRNFVLSKPLCFLLEKYNYS